MCLIARFFELIECGSWMGEEVLTYRGELEITSSAELMTAAAYRHSASFGFNFFRNVLRNSGG